MAITELVHIRFQAIKVKERPAGIVTIQFYAAIKLLECWSIGV